MKSKEQAIGIFDSGIGGLTVANAIAKELPNEDFIYFGDTAHLPYGDKSQDTIRYYSLRIAKFLLDKNCKMVVVACNSASTAANSVLLEFFQDRTHFINVVDPLVNACVTLKLSKVGIIATKATISSGVYQKQLKEKQENLKVHAKATPLFVPMIEEGFVHNNISQSIIENYLDDEGFNNMNALLLACTHYPLIKNSIQEYLGPNIKVLESSEVAAKAVRKTLEENDLLNPKTEKGDHKFYVSDLTESFAQTAQHFYGEDIDLNHLALWD
jgi:glutamate racemase